MSFAVHQLRCNLRSVSVLSWRRKVGTERGRGTAKEYAFSQPADTTQHLGDVRGLSQEALEALPAGLYSTAGTPFPHDHAP